MKQSAAKQTLKITAVNGVVRALGMLLRILLSRLLGAEIMGIAELSQSVHMLAITPLTSGLPLAVSRMTAKTRTEDRTKPLLAGLWLVRIAALVLMPLMLLFSPQLARLTGDVRVLPSLWCSAPCILILGYSAVYNGYLYGVERSLLPARRSSAEPIRLMPNKNSDKPPSIVIKSKISIFHPSFVSLILPILDQAKA